MTSGSSSFCRPWHVSGITNLLNEQDAFTEASEDSGFNRLIPGDDHSLGVVACGLGYNYYMENARKHQLHYPVLKVTQYPLPPHTTQGSGVSVDETPGD